MNPTSRVVTLVADTVTVVTLPADDVNTATNFVEIVTDGAAPIDFRVQESQAPVLVGDATFAGTGDIWTFAAHGLVDDDRVRFSAVGTGAVGYAVDTDYYVITSATNTFQLSATEGGAAIVGTGDSVGTWTLDKHFFWAGDDDSWTLPAVANVSRVIRAYGNGVTTLSLISSGVPVVTITGMDHPYQGLNI